MKHNLKITLTIILMFLITQLIGIYVVNYYSSVQIVDNVPLNVSAPSLPLGLGHPEIKNESDFLTLYLPTILTAFILAAALLFLLSKLKIDFILKAWFFIVITIALTIAVLAFLPQFEYSLYFGLAIAISLAVLKTFKRNPVFHNFTELFIYPGIAAVFVPILNIFSMVALLFVISLYDVWAVWHSGIMQKLAKYQINNLKVFPGFFLPHMTKETKSMIKKMKESGNEKKEFKVNVAILGGGDIVFPIIASGVALKTLGFTTIAGLKVPLASLLIVIGAFLGLAYLLFSSKEKRFYPAMPFISIGILVGMIISHLIL